MNWISVCNFVGRSSSQETKLSNLENSSRNWGQIWKTFGLILAGLFCLGVVGGIVFLMLFVNEVEQHEVGYMWDRRTGATTTLPRSGYFVTPPWLVKVHGIDTRPAQVCINANQRVLNCKLVQFNPAGIQQFVAWHGLQHGNVSEILKSYAYDGQNKTYPFLTIKTELGAQATGGTQQ
jgi:hypothetical protein